MTDLKTQLRIEADGAQAQTELGRVEKAAEGLSGGLNQAARAAGVYSDSQGKLREANGRFVSDARKAELGLQSFTGSTTKAAQGVRSISDQLQTAQTRVLQFAAANIGFGAAKGIANLADSYNSLQSRIKLAAGEGADYAAISQELFDIAQRTQQPLEAIGTLYTRTADALRGAGLSTQETIAFTETLAQSFRISGASAAESQAAIIQLSQGLAAGALRGDEFNSVAEQSPRLLQALSQGLGVSRGELRQMAEQGELTAEVITRALQGQATVIAEEYGQLPLTIGGAVTQLQNELQKYIGETGNAVGATDAVATTVKFLADNVERLDQLLLAVAAGGLAKITLALQAKATAALAAARNATALAAQTVALGAAASASTPAVAGLSASFNTLGGAISSALTAFAAFEGGQAIGGAIYDQIGDSLGDLIDRFTGLKATQDELTKGFVKGAAEQKDAAESQAKAVDGVAAALKRATGGLIDLSDGAEKAQASLGKLGAEQLVGGIGKLESQIRTAKDELAVFEDQMNSLSDEAFIEFEIANRDAFDKAVSKVRDLEAAVARLRDEQFKRLGIDTEAVLTGIDTKAKELLITFASLAADTSTDVRLIQAAFEGLLKKLDTPQELEALKASLAGVKDPAFDAAAAVGEIEKKLRDLPPAADSAAGKIADAFKAFGIETTEQIAEAARLSKENFDAVVRSGQASAAGLLKAFEDYARAQIKAGEPVIASSEAQRDLLLKISEEYARKAEAAESSSTRAIAANNNEVASLGAVEEAARRARIEKESLLNADNRANNLSDVSAASASIDGRGAVGFGFEGIERLRAVEAEIQRAINENTKLLDAVRGQQVQSAADVRRAQDLIANASVQAARLATVTGSDAPEARSLGRDLERQVAALQTEIERFRRAPAVPAPSPGPSPSPGPRPTPPTSPERIVRIVLVIAGAEFGLDTDPLTADRLLLSLADAQRGST